MHVCVGANAIQVQNMTFVKVKDLRKKRPVTITDAGHELA